MITIVKPSLPILPIEEGEHFFHPPTGPGLRRSSEQQGLGRPPCRLHIPGRPILRKKTWKVGISLGVSLEYTGI